MFYLKISAQTTTYITTCTCNIILKLEFKMHSGSHLEDNHIQSHYIWQITLVLHGKFPRDRYINCES